MSVRALCRIKLLPVTHLLVDTWMNVNCYCLYNFFNVYHLHSLLTIDLFVCSFFFYPVHPYFYPSKWWVDGSLHKAMVSALQSTAQQWLRGEGTCFSGSVSAAVKLHLLTSPVRSFCLQKLLFVGASPDLCQSQWCFDICWGRSYLQRLFRKNTCG